MPPKGYIASATYGGNAEIDLNVLKKDIDYAKSQANYVFVDMQWGGDYQREIVDYQTQYGHAAIDDGATIVTGVHTYWTQGIEYYNNGVIFYSLGNFINDQIFSDETRESIIVKHYYYQDKYIGFELFPIRMSDQLQLEFAQEPRKDIILKLVYDLSWINSQ
jgi:poly-gamma-glutamate synthesis protein (capsule biosynthesis protein)